jgi:hypothetical protein
VKVSSQSSVTTCKLRSPAFVTLGKYSVNRAFSTVPAVIPVSSTANRINAVLVFDTGSVVPVPFSEVRLRFVTTGGLPVLKVRVPEVSSVGGNITAPAVVIRQPIRAAPFENWRNVLIFINVKL